MARLPILTASAGAAPSAYKHLATTLLAAPAAAITASGLSTSNKLFRLIINAIPVTDSTSLHLRLNNDSGANYGYDVAYQGAGSVFNTVTASGATLVRLNDSSHTLDNARHSLFVLTVGKAANGQKGGGAGFGYLIDTTPVTWNQWIAFNWNDIANALSRFDIFMSSGNLDTSSMMRVEGLIP